MAREQEASRLAQWCDAVGPPIVQLEPATPAAHASDPLVVVSWNVHVGGGDMRALVADLRAGRLTGGRPVARFVLLLQEAYRAGPAVPPLPPGKGVVPRRVAPSAPGRAREDVVATAGALGLSLLYVPSMRNGMAAEDRGNAILSTLHLEDPSAIVLPLALQRRVATAATVVLSAPHRAPVRLHVVAAHLDTRAPWSRPLASLGAARLRQARALAEALDGASPIVIGGDLNTWSHSALEHSLPYLRARFPSASSDAHGPTYHMAGFGRRLDHMLARFHPGWHGRVHRVPDRYGSDHFPLLMTVRLP